MKIRSKLALIFSLAISVSLVLLGAVSFSVSSRTIRELTIQSNRRILQQINLGIDANIQEIERISRSVYASADVQEALASLPGAKSESERLRYRTAIRENLMSMMAMREDFSGIYLFPDTAETQPVFVRKGWAIRPDYDVRTESWYGDVMVSRGEKLVIGTHLEQQPIRDPEMVFSLARRIRDVSTGRGTGILLINISNGVLDEICTGAAFQEGSRIVLVGPAGRISFHSEADRVGTVLGALAIPLPPEQIGTAIDVEGEQALVTADYSTFSGFTAVSIVPFAVLNRGSNQIKWTTIIIVSFGVVAAVILSRRFSRHITRPITELQDLMKVAEGGNFHIHVPVERGDEVGDLARRFDFMMRRINELVQTVYEVRIRNQEAQLEVLQSKINPHFLYNTLDTIRGMALKKGADEIIDVVESLAHLFRYSMDGGHDLVSLGREIEYTRHYLRIQNHRLGNRFSAVIDVPNELERVPVPRLILQPLVENAIYYGMEGAEPGTRLDITGHGNGTFLTITVKDNGTGMEHDRLRVICDSLAADAQRFPDGFPVRTGIGILNVHGRLRKRFGPPSGLVITSEPGEGTRVDLTIAITGDSSWSV